MRHAAIIIGYVIAILGMPFALDASMYVDIAMIAAVTFLFVFTFVTWAHGRAVWALCIVVLLTVIFPVAVLLFIGSPTYASWTQTIQVVWRASWESSFLFGLEWGIPLVSGCAAAVLARYVRSNKPLQATRDLPPK
jgi:hypothetical protein